MTDYNNLIEKIKLSDVKISLLTKEIKEMEMEMKKIENETNIIKAKNKEVLQDIKYKKQILDDKNNEINILQKQSDIWAQMMEDKKLLIDEAEKELEEIQKNVFKSRITFNECGKEFINECDFLVTRAQDIELIIKNREEEKKLINEISVLEDDIKSVEKRYEELQKELKNLEDMEKVKQTLEKEPENSAEFQRIRQKIETYEEELDDLESKTSFRANQCTKIPMQKIKPFEHSYESDINLTYEEERGDDDQITSFIKENNASGSGSSINQNTFTTLQQWTEPFSPSKKKRKTSFTPKVQSNLTKRNLTKPKVNK